MHRAGVEMRNRFFGQHGERHAVAARQDRVELRFADPEDVASREVDDDLVTVRLRTEVEEIPQ